MPQRSSDIVEIHGQRALVAGIVGLISLAIASLLYMNIGGGGAIGLVIVLAIAGVASVIYAIYSAMQIRKVTYVGVECPYCSHKNLLTESPDRDFTCQGCHRLIPIVDGKPLPVHQVRCGYCNELNYYSDKTEVLLCEQCNREVPISVAEGRELRHSAFAVQDDDNLYEFRLIAHGQHKTEELMTALQQILALNRGQVKQMLEELPVTLLTGIPRKKAEMLQAQLNLYDATSEYSPIS
jgi:ribosomal protein S27E